MNNLKNTVKALVHGHPVDIISSSKGLPIEGEEYWEKEVDGNWYNEESGERISHQAFKDQLQEQRRQFPNRPLVGLTDVNIDEK